MSEDVFVTMYPDNPMVLWTGTFTQSGQLQLPQKAVEDGYISIDELVAVAKEQGVYVGHEYKQWDVPE